MSRVALVASFLLIAFATAIYYGQIKPTPADGQNYQQLLAKSKENRNKQSIKTHPIEQMRKGVRKEIWTPKNGARILVRLKSEDSQLTIQQKNNKLDLVEKLHNLECCMEDENKKEMRTLRSAEGTYLFPSHEFHACAVDMEFFKEQSPYLKGRATDVVFGAKDQELHFVAEHLEANLNHKKVLNEGL